MNADEDPNHPALWPEWATGLANGHVQCGAQLCTRDGRNMGNAVVTGEQVPTGQHVFWPIRTDAGNTLLLTDREINDLFWPPRWLTNPNPSSRSDGGSDPAAVPQELVELSAKASPAWALPARIAGGVVLGDAVHEYARGSGQSQIASFNVLRLDIDDDRDPTAIQTANTELAVACVNFVRQMIAAVGTTKPPRA